ncbi:hypothetical protein T02_16511 [Trichinella nativa]|uniref:Uncharacterized protein n=1 Tax=Trichinella nativa TaxID=6335 RepID=A0A0V1LGQ1_9BILA|nr:hypothetical protein T02_16511 [Trichinella nativa]
MLGPKALSCLPLWDYPRMITLPTSSGVKLRVVHLSSIRMRTAVPACPLLATYSSGIKSALNLQRTQLVNAPNLGSIASFTNDYAEHLTGYPAINTNPRYAIAHHAASISQPLHARTRQLPFVHADLLCSAETLRNIHEHLSTDMRITFSGLGTSTLDLLIRRTSE